MILDLILLVLGVAAISYTLTCTHLVAPLQRWRGEEGILIRCPWCMSWWVAAVLTPLAFPEWSVRQALLTWPAVVGASGLVIPVFLRAFGGNKA